MYGRIIWVSKTIGGCHFLNFIAKYELLERNGIAKSIEWILIVYVVSLYPVSDTIHVFDI